MRRCVAMLLILLLLTGSAFGEGLPKDIWICPSCDRVNGANYSFCPDCGTAKPAIEAPEEDWACPKCDQINDKSFLFCPFCGTAKPDTKTVSETVVSLNDLEYFQSHDMSLRTDYKNDNYGEAHSPSLCANDNSADREYLLKGEYKEFRANLYIIKGDDFSDLNDRMLSKAQICVYGDDTLLYTSPIFSLKDEPLPILVDISGAKFLKITMDNCYAKLALGEPVLVK